MSLGPEMELTSEAVGLGPRSKKKMAENGVTSFQRLIEVIKESPAIIDPFKESEKALLKVIDWANAFQEDNGRVPVMTEEGDFSEDIFYEYIKKRSDFVVCTMPREDCDKLMRAIEKVENRKRGK